MTSYYPLSGAEQSRLIHQDDELAPAAVPDAGAPQETMSVSDVLAYCSGRLSILRYYGLMHENMWGSPSVDMDCERQFLTAVQAYISAPAAHQETPEPQAEAWLKRTTLAEGWKESEVGYAEKPAVERVIRRILGACSDPVPELLRFIEQVGAPARAAEWQPLIEAAKDAVREWRLHGQLTDSCRHLEAALNALPPPVPSRVTPTRRHERA